MSNENRWRLLLAIMFIGVSILVTKIICIRKQGQTDLQIKELQFQLNTNFKNCGKNIRNAMISDTLWHTADFHAIFADSCDKMLIFRYSDSSCGSCVQSAIGTMNSLMYRFSTKKVAYISNCANRNIMKAQIRHFGLDNYSVFNCKQIDIPVEEKGFPYCFVMDSSCNVISVYMLMGDYHKDSEYINNMYKYCLQ